MVHRKFMMFEFAAIGCLIAAASEFEAWELFLDNAPSPKYSDQEIQTS